MPSVRASHFEERQAQAATYLYVCTTLPLYGRSFSVNSSVPVPEEGRDRKLGRHSEDRGREGKAKVSMEREREEVWETNTLDARCECIYTTSSALVLPTLSRLLSLLPRLCYGSWKRWRQGKKKVERDTKEPELDRKG